MINNRERKREGEKAIVREEGGKEIERGRERKRGGGRKREETLALFLSLSITFSFVSVL